MSILIVVKQNLNDINTLSKTIQCITAHQDKFSITFDVHPHGMGSDYEKELLLLVSELYRDNDVNFTLRLLSHLTTYMKENIQPFSFITHLVLVVDEYLSFTPIMLLQNLKTLEIVCPDREWMVNSEGPCLAPENKAHNSESNPLVFTNIENLVLRGLDKKPVSWSKLMEYILSHCRQVTPYTPPYSSPTKRDSFKSASTLEIDDEIPGRVLEARGSLSNCFPNLKTLIIPWVSYYIC